MTELMVLGEYRLAVSVSLFEAVVCLSIGFFIGNEILIVYMII